MRSSSLAALPRLRLAPDGRSLPWEPLSDNPGRLLLDIDYILQWVALEPPATTLSFWISPATLDPRLGPDHRHRPDRVEFQAVPKRDHTV